MQTKTALDLIKSAIPKPLRGARLGLLVHPASVNSKIVHSSDIFTGSGLFKVTAFFGPQHGIRGETQDNMIEWEGFKDKRTGIRVFSLYGEKRMPTSEMLDKVDCLVIDLQDVGARFYTFIWTMYLSMSACMKAGKAVMVIDRPNPIGGKLIDGPVLDPAFASFVGMAPLPIRHGMTIGEIALYFKEHFYQTLQLHVLKMKRWQRDMWFDETNLPWVMPSPNMPTLDTTTVYPGQCLLEGTLLSEGRGTTRPFEMFGAPFIDPHRLVKRLGDFNLKGVVFRPVYFIPTFQKHAGSLCGGAQIHVTCRRSFMPFKTSAAILRTVREQYPAEKIWSDPPYEYEMKKLPIDIIVGTDRFRMDIDRGTSLSEMQRWWDGQCDAFNDSIRKGFLLYN